MRLLYLMFVRLCGWLVLPGNERLHVAQLDLTDLNSVAAFVASWEGPLHVLVNNAGVMASPEEHTAQGWELQFATNHLGHFALAAGLHDALAGDGAARIVSVRSKGRQLSPVIVDDLHFAFRPDDPWLAYGQSKTANVLFAAEATRRWAADGITAHSLMPGAVLTNLQRHIGGGGSGRVPADQRKSIEQGARPRCSSQCRRCSTASVAATSPTATRVRSCTGPAATWAVWPTMPSTPPTPSDSGRCPTR
jgi:NAD(P)-dependent dehydrogenase (short-subunit alcohol dehydrogenase family)